MIESKYIFVKSDRIDYDRFVKKFAFWPTENSRDTFGYGAVIYDRLNDCYVSSKGELINNFFVEPNQLPVGVRTIQKDRNGMIDNYLDKLNATSRMEREIYLAEIMYYAS